MERKREREEEGRQKKNVGVRRGERGKERE